jgi:DNA sulfur modification protein DndD
VSAVFSARGRTYTAARAQRVRKAENGDRIAEGSSALSLGGCSETGEWEDAKNPQDQILKLLPREMWPFLFFNGEQIHELASAGAYERIEEGVEVLLDLELFNRAISHLESGPARRLRERIGEHSGEEGVIAKKERDALEEKRTAAEEDIAQLRRNRIALEDEKEELDAALAGMPELAALQAERKEKEQRLRELKGEIGEARKRLAEAVSRDGYLLVAGDAISAADAAIGDAHKKGQIPSPMKRQFVDELLEAGRCICGAELVRGEAGYGKVESWRDRSMSEQIEALATTTKAALGSLGRRMEEARETIGRLQSAREQAARAVRETEERLSEISVLVGDRDKGEDPFRLEMRRKRVEEEIGSLDIKVHDAEGRVREVDDDLIEKDKEIRKLEKADAKGLTAQRQLDAVVNVLEVLKRIREIRREELRSDLSLRLHEVWSGIAIKDYEAELDRGFHLTLTKTVAGERAPVRGASTGEKQVLSLAFIGSVVDRARMTMDDEDTPAVPGLFVGGRYALVIDSAFGQLEPEYRREVARWMPSLASQLIVLVSETQWRREVQEELEGRVGREWVLCCETKKQKAKDIVLRGKTYPYVVESASGERTDILEVEVDG